MAIMSLTWSGGVFACVSGFSLTYMHGLVHQLGLDNLRWRVLGVLSIE